MLRRSNSWRPGSSFRLASSAARWTSSDQRNSSNRAAVRPLWRRPTHSACTRSPIQRTRRPIGTFSPRWGSTLSIVLSRWACSCSRQFPNPDPDRARVVLRMDKKQYKNIFEAVKTFADRKTAEQTERDKAAMRRRNFAHSIAAVICSLCILPIAAGQISDNWQAVPQEDLSLKDNPASPGSAAMILERQVYANDEKRVQTEWVRIKVFTEAGRAHADVEIPYLAKSTTIEGIRGRTIRPDGTIVVFNGAVFDNVLLKYKRFRYEAKTFTLPGGESGAVIEYVYTMHWKEKLPDYVRNPIGYRFQEGWTVPITTWTVQQELFTRHAVFVLRPVRAGRLGFAKVRLSDVGPYRRPDGTVRMEVANIAALEKEDYMPPESMLTSRVHLYYEVGFLTDYWRDWGKIRAEAAG